MADAIEAWLRARPPSKTAALFSTRENTRISDRFIRTLVSDYGRKAGIRKPVHAEALRAPIPHDDPYFRELLTLYGVERTPPRQLEPFKPKADVAYITEIQGGPMVKTREHETLVNSFERWLTAKGLMTARNAAVDLAVLREGKPPVLVEAKAVRNWPAAVREAAGQLYEYRWFNVADPKADLIFLASEPVPGHWVEYLERDRRIGVVWRDQGRFRPTPWASGLLTLATQNAPAS